MFMPQFLGSFCYGRPALCATGAYRRIFNLKTWTLKTYRTQTRRIETERILPETFGKGRTKKNATGGKDRRAGSDCSIQAQVQEWGNV
jgi:hypothetical protein